jgi:hypothetical protein
MSIRSFVKRLLTWLGIIKKEPERSFIIQWYPNYKPYDDMTPKEKRKYKAWLRKNHYWDGAILVENAFKKSR